MTPIEVLHEKLNEAKEYAKQNDLQMFSMIIDSPNEQIHVVAKGKRNDTIEALVLAIHNLCESN